MTTLNNAYEIGDSGATIATFTNIDLDKQWILDIAVDVSLWYIPTIRQAIITNESEQTIYWITKGELTGADGSTTLFSSPKAGGSPLSISPKQNGYFSLDGEFSEAFNVTVTNSAVTLSDVEIKILHEDETRLYHFNLNNTCFEAVNTIQVSSISQTVY